jgi:hypothetical protein
MFQVIGRTDASFGGYKEYEVKLEIFKMQLFNIIHYIWVNTGWKQFIRKYLNLLLQYMIRQRLRKKCKVVSSTSHFNFPNITFGSSQQAPKPSDQLFVGTMMKQQLHFQMQLWIFMVKHYSGFCEKLKAKH